MRNSLKEAQLWCDQGKRGRAPIRRGLRLAARAQDRRGLKEALTENERYAVADHVVSQLKEHGDPWNLSEEARPKGGPTTS
jgi:hypothetical protein